MVRAFHSLVLQVHEATLLTEDVPCAIATHGKEPLGEMAFHLGALCFAERDEGVLYDVGGVLASRQAGGVAQEWLLETREGVQDEHSPVVFRHVLTSKGQRESVRFIRPVRDDFAADRQKSKDSKWISPGVEDGRGVSEATKLDRNQAKPCESSLP